MNSSIVYYTTINLDSIVYFTILLNFDKKLEISLMNDI